MNTFLSIDIDYWDHLHDDGTLAEASLVPVLTRAREMGIPIHAVMNHHQMLPRVNRSGATKLVNVDTHADLAERDVTVFNCGTWVAFVKWRRYGTFHWIRSDRRTIVGDCNGGCGWNHDHDWKSVRSWYGGKSPRMLHYLPDCCEIGLCMSPSYSNPRLQRLFRDLTKRFDVPYQKGRLDEHSFERRLSPPRSSRPKALPPQPSKRRSIQRSACASRVLFSSSGLTATPRLVSLDAS